MCHQPNPRLLLLLLLFFLHGTLCQGLPAQLLSVLPCRLPLLLQAWLAGNRHRCSSPLYWDHCLPPPLLLLRPQQHLHCW
jgi:hypothetical protein